MTVPGSYANGFAPRDGQPLYPELWRGCVGAWAPCLGPTGLTLRDWGGYRNNGTLTNMDAGTDWVLSSGRYAVDFDGVNDYVDLGAVRQMQQSGNLSVSCWFMLRTLSAERGIVTRTNGGDVGFQLCTNAANLRWPRYNSPLQFAIATNTPYHVCGIHRNGVNELWVNGILRGTLTEAMGTDAVNAVIGRLYPAAAAFYTDGVIDDVRMYNQPLAPSAIRLLASRRGIAYELAPRRRASLIAAFNRRRRLLLGSI